MIRDLQNVDDDISKMKRLIKQKLVGDRDILEALNNQELDIDSPDEFLDTNIFAYLKIPTIQDRVKNFICFAVDDIQDSRYNELNKIQYIRILVICHLSDIKTKYGIDRHDLLGYLIRDLFNWTNDFGIQFKLVYDKEDAVDADYYYRELRFEATKLNSLNKAIRMNPNDRVRSR